MMTNRIEKLFENVKVNEQVERLAKESGCTIDKLGYGEGNLEKFALLIVRECCEVAHCNFHVDGLTLGTILKEHFGVEE